MTEKEYYERLLQDTVYYNCERCIYGYNGECHLNCNKSYEDYMKEERELIDSVGF